MLNEQEEILSGNAAAKELLDPLLLSLFTTRITEHQTGADTGAV